jgi:tRNA-2-methylthio-N6-dimethylallyladenosine synthase
VTVTRGAPHYLLSDAAPRSVRRTRAGDAWQAAAAAPVTVPPAPVTPAPPESPVLLGMPSPRPLTTAWPGPDRRHRHTGLPSHFLVSGGHPRVT